MLLFFLLISCNENNKPVISFYYWKTIFKLSETEKEVIRENNVHKIYIRYFDIDLHPKNESPIPLSPIRFQEKMNGFDIVPVIYIKNKVMLKPNLDIDDLVRKSVGLVNEINFKNKINCKLIQIDCDWTLSSKDNYLKFIAIFKSFRRRNSLQQYDYIR